VNVCVSMGLPREQQPEEVAVCARVQPCPLLVPCKALSALCARVGAAGPAVHVCDMCVRLTSEKTIAMFALGWQTTCLDRADRHSV